MMKTILVGCITFLILGCNKPPDNAVDLLKANLKATGGEEKWENLRSLKTGKVTTTLINDKEVSKVRINEKIKVPGLFKEEIFTNDSLTVVTVRTANESFYFKFEKGKPVGYTVLEPEVVSVKPELDLLKNAGKFKFEETIWNDLEVLKLTNHETKEEFVYDKKSYLLLAYNSETLYGTSTTVYDDYREAEGFHFAFRELTGVPSASYEVSTIISDLKVNPEFDEGTFSINKDWIVLKQGTIVPEFEIFLMGEETESIKNSDLKGKIVLLDFWATWCKPCIAEFPNLKEQYKKYNQSGFEVLSVSLDEDTTALKKYLEKNNLPWINTWVKDGFQSALAKDFQIAGIPKTILFGKDGMILALDKEATGESLNEKLQNLYTSKRN